MASFPEDQLAAADDDVSASHPAGEDELTDQEHREKMPTLNRENSGNLSSSITRLISRRTGPDAGLGDYRDTAIRIRPDDGIDRASLSNPDYRLFHKDDPQARFAAWDSDDDEAWMAGISPLTRLEDARSRLVSSDTPLLKGTSVRDFGGGSDSDYDEFGADESLTWDGMKSRWEERRRKYFNPTRATYYFPIIGWLPKYRLSDLPADLVAGLAVSMLLIPQAIAYAIIAGLPPEWGLYASIVPVMMYTIFGTCPQLAIGPEGVVALLVGEAVHEIVAKTDTDDSDSAGHDELAAGIISLSLWVGLICLFLGIIRAGFLVNLISRPVLHGFICASALIIIGDQLVALFGITETTEGVEDGLFKYIDVMKHLGSSNGWTVLVGFSTIVLFIGTEMLKKILAKRFHRAFSLLPTTFILVALGILVGYTAELDECCDVHLLGVVSGGPPPVAFPPFWDHTDLFPTALVIFIVGFVEATAVAKTYGQKHRYSVSPNRELIAFSVGNLIGSCFSAFPTFGSLPRSRVADLAGARTTINGFIAAVVVLLCSLFAMSVFKFLPSTVVAGIIVCAASMLIEIEDFQHMFKLRAWRELCMAGAVFLTTFIAGPSLGIVLALLISIYFVVRKSTSLDLIMLTPSGESAGDGHTPSSATEPDMMILRIDESLYFANVSQLKELLRRTEHFGAPHAHPSSERVESMTRGVIMCCENMPTIDPESVEVMREIVEDFRVRDITVFFVRLHKQPLQYLVRGKVLGKCGLLPMDHVFQALSVAVEAMLDTFHEDYVRPDILEKDVDEFKFVRQTPLLGKSRGGFEKEEDHQMRRMSRRSGAVEIDQPAFGNPRGTSRQKGARDANAMAENDEDEGSYWTQLLARSSGVSVSFKQDSSAALNFFGKGKNDE